MAFVNLAYKAAIVLAAVMLACFYSTLVTDSLLPVYVFITCTGLVWCCVVYIVIWEQCNE